MNRRFTILAALLFLCSCASAPGRPRPIGAEGEPPPAPADPEVRAALVAIESIPPWVTTRYGPAEVEKLEAAACTLSALPIERVRDAVVHLAYRIHRKGGIVAASQVYLALRAIFEVPESFDRAKVQEFGAWLHPSQGKGREKEPFALSWPVHASNGRIVEVEKFPGYIGDPYDGVGEFDWFRARFPLRKLAPPAASAASGEAGPASPPPGGA
jgi:hypothetical protein